MPSHLNEPNNSCTRKIPAENRLLLTDLAKCCLFAVHCDVCLQLAVSHLLGLQELLSTCNPLLQLGGFLWYSRREQQLQKLSSRRQSTWYQAAVTVSAAQGTPREQRATHPAAALLA